MFPGTAFLALHSDPEHGYFYPKHGRKPWVFLWISFFGGTVGSIIDDMIERHGYLYDLPLKGGLIKKLESYRRYNGKILTVNPMRGAEIVTGSLAELEAAKESDESETDSTIFTRKARRFVIERIAENINVNDVAEHLRISREHFSRVFKERVGETPAAFIRRIKIQFAEQLLKETTLSCKEIADRVGYGPASFNRFFLRETGSSPGAYRLSPTQSND